jgi:hypothetical protein
MYTGNLISELMAAVEHAEQAAEERRVAEELHEIYTMQIEVASNDRFVMGAA